MRRLTANAAARISAPTDGRIVAEDVEKAAAAPATAPATAAAPAAPKPAAAAASAPQGTTPMNAMQKAVVKNMEWANAVPTYTVSRAIVTDELDSLYKLVTNQYAARDEHACSCSLKRTCMRIPRTGIVRSSSGRGL